ncbi:hypothetical protein P170DRAFT_427466 [Aspergillus steynii IBT 23096]|uniref:Tat pathway signal sequence n=1 Tax=Aspergillus steynii IBT 23096 TaxID=1392250 RepID=A0A2I2G682_9EURO|nr:uncharacterized protein P170DRAFT_427466 [Aspergillus steynii IBT 23096]PLB48380.1 hypothetical protein P170DRAFT_427466 [Aspergillus steynii IBT 23096]
MSAKYEQLDSSSDEGYIPPEDLLILISSLKASQRKQSRLLIFQWVLLTLIFLTALGLLVAAGVFVHDIHQCPLPSERECRVPGEIYSPAQDVVRYHNVTFTRSLEPDLTKYQGPPSDENYAAWEDLYDFSLSKIPLSSAAQLVDKTVPIPDSPGDYAIALDVFHQLHCLNMIRLKLWAGESPAYINHTLDAEMTEMNHIDHCLDSVRQSVMCHSDIAPITWTWDDSSGSAKGVLTNHHTCRDFEAIRTWAMEHHAEAFDKSVRVEDPLDNYLGS